jgi:Xaa-Pro dipeptidase
MPIHCLHPKPTYLLKIFNYVLAKNSDEMSNLRERLKKIFKGSDAECMLLMNSEAPDSNFLYLTGFTSGVFEDAVLITEEDSMTLLTNDMEYGTAMAQKPALMKVKSLKSGKELTTTLLKELKGRTVGINESFLSFSRYQKLKKISKPKRFIGIGKKFLEARSVKDEGELQNIKKAASITHKAFDNIESKFRKGMTEKEVAAEFDYMIRYSGAQENAFKTIVAFGANSAMPHHMPDGTRLTDNSIVLIDAGARWNNYCADMTRTFVFKPERSSTKFKRISQMVEVVELAQEKARSILKEGVDGSKADRAARTVIDTAHGGVYKGKFIHSLGHSIGIDVHDGYVGLAGSLHIKMKAGMVVSDEPGIYITGFGGVRLEDDILITHNGAEFL